MKLSSTFWLVSIVFVASCSHADTQPAHLESKLDSETSVESYEALTEEVKTVIAGSSQINESKKKELLDLKIKTVRNMDKLQKEILKNKSVLLKNILSDRYSEKEVTAIKKQIVRLSEDKNKMFFSALDEAKRIVKDLKDKETIIEKLHLDWDMRSIRDGSANGNHHH